MLKKIVLPLFVMIVLIIISFLLFGDLESYFTDLLLRVRSRPVVYACISTLILLSDILLPVPSSIVMYTNGFVLGILPGTMVSITSLMLGSLFGYYLGKISSVGRKAVSNHYVNNLLAKYGALSILITRGVPVLSESTCFLYGYNRMPLKKYLLFNLLGYVPLSLLYAITGSIGYEQNTFLMSFGISVILSFLIWLWGKKLLTIQFNEAGVQK